MFAKTVDTILKQFNKVVIDLEKLAEIHKDQAEDKEVRRIMLDQEIKAHNDEANKAKQVAERIRNLVAA